MIRSVPDFDVTLVVRVLDDEERVGHMLLRLARHLRGLGVRFEILVADEGSGDNTAFVATMVKSTVREIEIVHADEQLGFATACARARGRAIVLIDGRSDAPLSALGLALERLHEGADVVAVDGRYLVFRRTRAWRAFDALRGPRDFVAVERRFLKRARLLGLVIGQARRARRPSGWSLGRLFGTLVAART
jgi:hypothetical protein